MKTRESKFPPRYISNDLTSQITKHIEQLAQATDVARVSEEMLLYLEVCSRFHKYSLYNLWLILMTKPQATYVAGFRTWQSMNRFVKRGEHGIPILAPVLVKEDKNEKESSQKLVAFKVVFDVSQTDGEPLPEPPEWKSPEKNALLATKLIAFANSKGMIVKEKQLAGDVQGVSKGGTIELSPLAGTATLIHEIAHELLHQGVDRPIESKIREMEAEAVAYVIGKHFGLDNLASPNYVALHGADSKLIFEHLECIRRVSTEIIGMLE